MKTKRITSAALALCLALSLCVGAQAAGSRQEALQALGILSGDDSLSSTVTRAQFAQMLTAASPYKDAAEGYGVSLFKDLKGDHWASGSVRVAIEQGWMTGYVDGTFRPDQAITLEEGCAALLKALGYDPSDLKGAYPAAQLSKASSVGLLDGVSAEQGAKLTRQDCVNLFYNLLTAKTSAGTVYGTALGCTVTNGQVDYSALVSAGTKGPYVADSAALSLPLTPTAVYCNGALSSLASVQQYDVYYYSANMGTVWVYRSRVTGTLTGLSPSAAAPTAVTVAGVSYQLGTSEAAYQLSSQGSFREGDLVTLLLGMNGEVVRVIDALENEAVYYGTVVSSAKGASTSSTTSSSTASAQVTTQVACTDGVVHTFYHSGSALSAGKLVTVSATQSGTTVRSLSAKKLEGAVSKDGTGLGNYRFADGVQILDTDENGGYVRIYPSRLAGVRLSGEDVRCYTLNADGEIDRMLLRNVTGDIQSYVYISRVEDNSMEMNVSVDYTYILDGQAQSLHSSAKYPVSTGGAALVYEKGSLKSIRQLTSVSLDSLSSLSAMGGGREYKLAEDIQVLLRDSTGGQGYYLTELSQVNGEDFKLTGWYDSLGFSAGGRVRIIVASPK
ncbi:S-layer homology domain-containing protein [Colidextribacter sp. OB.20]|uniref:S-layer homology domain-containing protein n=1 Tax=Colidextribacter sp. OB.20 TaxID=2304568 RepID=UPI00136866FD|nr:S-layer homology domain-containing protein [Colidextribacter sp. OB.20]NBI10325.1 S-layer homology domain-containing protein [Colidextribacter sp. OB.20]